MGVLQVKECQCVGCIHVAHTITANTKAHTHTHRLFFWCVCVYLLSFLVVLPFLLDSCFSNRHNLYYIYKSSLLTRMQTHTHTHRNMDNIQIPSNTYSNIDTHAHTQTLCLQLFAKEFFVFLIYRILVSFGFYAPLLY